MIPQDLVEQRLIAQGEIWWADLGEPKGSEAAYKRPVLIAQGDAFNRSKIATVLCVPLTSNMKWADAPGNVKLLKSSTGLKKDSVANISLILTLNKDELVSRVGKISERQLERIFSGIDILLAR